MEAKHTPGPWTVSDHDTTQIRGAGPDYRGDIASVHISRDPERMDADANLIASAPTLLAALEHATDLLRVYGMSSPPAIIANALRLARGAS